MVPVICEMSRRTKRPGGVVWVACGYVCTWLCVRVAVRARGCACTWLCVRVVVHPLEFYGGGSEISGSHWARHCPRPTQPQGPCAGPTQKGGRAEGWQQSGLVQC